MLHPSHTSLFLETVIIKFGGPRGRGAEDRWPTYGAEGRGPTYGAEDRGPRKTNTLILDYFKKTMHNLFTTNITNCSVKQVL